MRNLFDVSLVDDVLLHEVELTTQLIVAANESVEARLSQEEIDAILEVDPPSPGRNHDSQMIGAR